jgi:hypothetical protein
MPVCRGFLVDEDAAGRQLDLLELGDDRRAQSHVLGIRIRPPLIEDVADDDERRDQRGQDDAPCAWPRRRPVPERLQLWEHEDDGQTISSAIARPPSRCVEHRVTTIR